MSDGSDLAFLLEPVARRLLGEPGPLSTDDVLRFGPTGALWVDLSAHQWGDYDDDSSGGGILELVEYRTGQANGEALTWLTEHGFSLVKSEILVNGKGGDADKTDDRSAGKYGLESNRQDKTPPRELVNLELEQQLLGALLIHPGEIPGVAFSLHAAHFAEPLHRRLYDVMVELAKSGKHVSPITIQPYLPDVAKDFDLKAYIAKLAAEYAGAPAEAFSSGIIELAIGRKLIEVGEGIAAAARAPDPAEPAKLQIETAITHLTTLASAGLRPMLRASSVGSAAQAIVEEMDAPTPQERPVPTGLADIDKRIGGYRRGTLVILAARPGVGKTMLAGSLSLQAARRAEGVVFFSMEMTKAQLTARLLTNQAYRSTQPVVYQSILDGTLNDEHRSMVKAAAREIDAYPMIIDPQPAMSIAEIGVRAARYIESFAKRGLRTPLIVVDHLGKVRRPFKTQDTIEIGQITNRAAALAKELSTCVLMLCQLNRLVESRDDRRPQLMDLRASGNIEEDADVVLMLYREAYYAAKATPLIDPEAEMERANKVRALDADMDILVTKNRHGAEGAVRVWCHMGAGIVRDREERY